MAAAYRRMLKAHQQPPESQRLGARSGHDFGRRARQDMTLEKGTPQPRLAESGSAFTIDEGVVRDKHSLPCLPTFRRYRTVTVWTLLFPLLGRERPSRIKAQGL